MLLRGAVDKIFGELINYMCCTSVSVPTSYLEESGSMLLHGAVDKIFGELINYMCCTSVSMRDAHLAITNREY